MDLDYDEISDKQKLPKYETSSNLYKISNRLKNIQKQLCTIFYEIYIYRHNKKHGKSEHLHFCGLVIKVSHTDLIGN